MIKKILYCICLYLVAMLLFYGASSIFGSGVQEDKNAYLNTEVAIEESQALQQEKTVTQTENTDLYINQVKSNTKGNPFSMDVNIINQIEAIENRTNYKPSYFMADISRFDVIEEIEKRKCKIKYKRIFCLCFINNKLKRLTAKKMAITNRKEVNVDGYIYSAT